MYIDPMVTAWWKGCPVLPSYSVVWPESGSPANCRYCRISCSVDPLNTGDAMNTPEDMVFPSFRISSSERSFM